MHYLYVNDMPNNGGNLLAHILPIEIWQLILSYCSFWDFMRFRQTCKRGQKLPIPDLPSCYSSECSANHFKKLNDTVIKQLNGLQNFTYKIHRKITIPVHLLTNLTRLKIIGYNSDSIKMKNQQCLKIGKLTQLKELEIFDYNPTIKYFTDLKALTKLALYGFCSVLENELKMMTNLLSLDIARLKADFTNLDTLQKLTFLSVPSCMQNSEINKLTNLLDLKLFCFYYRTTDLNGLSKLTRLKTYSHSLAITNNSVRNLTNLKVLSASLITDFNSMIQLTKLKVLRSSNVFGDFVFNEFAFQNLTNLVDLKIIDHPKIKKIKNISHLTSLKHLTLVHTEVQTEELQGLTNLESLKVVAFPLKSIGPLTRLTSLKANYINNDLVFLRNLEFLGEFDDAIDLNRFTKLTKLDFRQPKVNRSFKERIYTNIVDLVFWWGDDYSYLDCFPNLTSLNIEPYCNKQILNHVTNLHKLKILKGVHSYLFHGLLGLKNLERIDFTPESSKFEEVFKGKFHVKYN